MFLLLWRREEQRQRQPWLPRVLSSMFSSSSSSCWRVCEKAKSGGAMTCVIDVEKRRAGCERHAPKLAANADFRVFHDSTVCTSTGHTSSSRSFFLGRSTKSQRCQHSACNCSLTSLAACNEVIVKRAVRERTLKG